MTRTADVVVIGGGVIGCSLAYHLARAGARRVVVLERRTLASGGTGRSVGIVRQLYPTPEATRMVVRSLETFRRFGEVVGGHSGYVACGVLIGVAAEARERLERIVAGQRDLGVRAEIVDSGALQRLEPRIDRETTGVVLWEPDSGYGDPTAVTLGYADAARRLGVTIEQGAEVIGVARAGDRVGGVSLASGDTLEAPVVVNAAGLWSPAVARLAGIGLPIVVGRHPVFVVERAPDFGPAHLVYLDLAGGVYVRPETGNLTLTGSLTDDEAEHPMDPESLGAEVSLDEAVPVLERTGRALPRLTDAAYRRGWAGAFDITPDWMPILDESPLAGFWIAAGMSGHGFKLAPAVGEMLAAAIMGEMPPVSLAPFRLDRFAGAAGGSTFVASYLGA